MKKVILRYITCFIILSVLTSFFSFGAFAYQIGVDKHGAICKGMGRFRPINIYVDLKTPDLYVRALKDAVFTWNNAKYGTFFVIAGRTSASITHKFDGYSTFQAYDYSLRPNYDPNRIVLGTNNRYTDDDGYIKEIDISLNSSVPYFYSENGDTDLGPMMNEYYDLVGVITHELGHALGLGHSEYPGAVMYDVMTPGIATQRKLTADDIAGLGELYTYFGDDDDIGGGPPPPEVPDDDDNIGGGTTPPEVPPEE